MRNLLNSQNGILKMRENFKLFIEAVILVLTFIGCTESIYFMDKMSKNSVPHQPTYKATNYDFEEGYGY